MAATKVTVPKVTIVVVPRERFSYTRESLASIYRDTDEPFELVYVDGGSPHHVRRFLKHEARARGFRLIRVDQYISPNRARNLGLRVVRTPYVVFIDNDVVVSRGWLRALVECAEQTGAVIVTPLTCEGLPLHDTVHCAGGEVHVESRRSERGVTRHLVEKIYLQGSPVRDVRGKLTRGTTELAEFHCMFVRTDTFEKTGVLDERMLTTKEHLDFCMTVVATGKSIVFEPSAVVTYVPGTLAWSDMVFYMVRWSDVWQRASLDHLREKWQLEEDRYFTGRYRRLGGRRYEAVIHPFMRRLPRVRGWHRVERMVVRAERALSRGLTAWCDRRLLSLPSEPVSAPVWNTAGETAPVTSPARGASSR